MYTIYTDGACSGNKRGANCVGGYGYSVLLPDGKSVAEGNGYELNTTNNRMEMMAVVEGIKALLEDLKSISKEPKEADVTVVTDSKYVSDNFVDYLPTWKVNRWRRSDGSPVKNKDLWKKIEQVSSALGSFSFKWVKGHNGHEMNERVDGYATEAIRRGKRRQAAD